ncbi:quinoprotein relay system zinc metallohydrolase 2 [Chthonobacter albigriseus]|uniref:quinoprotein relay system zinc metallohydrolase 2 n=1 Tax=Chthonobacter albigriseus TaxID=1683161 RepID=UPI001FCE815B|nr:quinoprotein relay system zinc metallohydrolase 2 [Chthonobacter albigriseus]
MTRHASKAAYLNEIRGLITKMHNASIGAAYRVKVITRFAAHSFIAVHNKTGLRLSYHWAALVYVLLTYFSLVPISFAADDPRPLEVKEVAPGVFVHKGINALMLAENGGAIANVGFVVGAQSVAVIDTGGSRRQGEALLKSIEQHTDLPVRWVINTHVHPDHVFGNAAFLGRDVAFVGHVRLPDALQQRFEHYLAANRASMTERLLAGTELVLPTETVADVRQIDLGGRILTLRAWPVAHTDSDLTVFDETTGTLFSGDLVFLEHLPSIDGSLRGWQKALDGLAAIPATRVVPGHGPIDSPWPAAIEPERRYFDALAKDLKTAIDAGIPLATAVQTAGEGERGDWLLFDQFNMRNATAAYAELEWE